jgi:salicylate hydroxylase
MYSPSSPLGDAEALAGLFSGISDRAQIPTLLSAYEEIRQTRAVSQAGAGERLVGSFMLPPGPLQQVRDATFRDIMAYARENLDAHANDDVRAEMLHALWSEYFEICAHDPCDAVQDWWTTWGGSMGTEVSSTKLVLPLEGLTIHD